MSRSRGSRRQLSFVNTEPSTCCTLCRGHHRQFSTPATWKSENARTLAHSLKLSPNDPVCYACRKDVARVLADHTHIPRWEKDRSENVCCIAGCPHSVFASLHKASLNQLQSAFDTADLKCICSEIPLPTPLCKHHYHLIYNTIQPVSSIKSPVSSVN